MSLIKCTDQNMITSNSPFFSEVAYWEKKKKRVEKEAQTQDEALWAVKKHRRARVVYSTPQLLPSRLTLFPSPDSELPWAQIRSLLKVTLPTFRAQHSGLTASAPELLICSQPPWRQTWTSLAGGELTWNGKALSHLQVCCSKKTEPICWCGWA